MVLSVLRRIQWGIGLFCFWAFASFCLVRKDLWLYIRGKYSSAIFCFKRFFPEKSTHCQWRPIAPPSIAPHAHPSRAGRDGEESTAPRADVKFEVSSGTGHTGILTDSA